MDGWMGWDGMDGTEYQKCLLKIFILCWYIDKVYTYLMGWDGMELDGMGYQKCPSIFFILCGYIHKVYTYLYI